jgi:tetratricopeptide (TPR) repeat protein
LVQACVNKSQPEAVPIFLSKELARWQQLAGVHTDKSGCQVQMLDLQHRLATWFFDAGQFNLAKEHFSASRELFGQLKVDPQRMLNSAVRYLKSQRHALPVLRSEMDSEQLALRELVVQSLEPLLAISRKKVEEAPKNSDAWERWSLIAMNHYRERNWKGVEREAELAIKLPEAGPDKLMRIVPFFLLAGKHDAYREACESFLEGSERWSGNDLGNAAGMCLLDPRAPLDPQRLLRLVQRTVDAGPEWSRPYLAVANIRVGEELQAIEDLLSQTTSTTHDGQIEPVVCLWVAIGHHQAGRLEEAQTWLEKAQTACDNWDSPYANSRITVQVLLQEVESKLEIDSDTAPSNGLY